MNLTLPKNIKLPHYVETVETDWKIIFFTTLILGIGAIFFGLYLFVRVNGGTIFAPEVAEPVGVEAPSSQTVKGVVEQFEKERQEHEIIRKGKEIIPDPSI